jgi:hypothetical protein
MHDLRDLDGTATVRARIADDGEPQLTIQSPHYVVNGAIVPAQSIYLSGPEVIAALHQVCQDLLEAHAEATQETV